MRTRSVVAALFLALLASALPARAATYYVSGAGSDSNAGTSTASPWRTLAKVNGFAFAPGDSVLLRRGDVFSDATLRSPRVDNFTVADYGTGAKPIIDGDRFQPVNITASPAIRNLTLRNIDISGQDWSAGKASNIWIQYVDGVTLDGIEGDGFRNGNTSAGKNAITLINCTGALYVRNCNLRNWGPTNLPAKTEDFIALVLYEIATGTYEIANNVIHNVNADCIQVYETKAAGKIHDNTLYNAGEDTIDVKGTWNCEIYENEHYRTADFTGEGGSGSGGLPTLLVIHEGGVTTTAQNITVRNSRLHDSNIAVGIKLGNTVNVNIEANCFENVAGAVYMGLAVKDTRIHHNVVKNPVFRADYQDMDAGGIFENNASTGTQIYNNTFYNVSGTGKNMISIAFSAGTQIRDNVAYQRSTAADAYSLYVFAAGTRAVVQNNCWYNPASGVRVKYWGSTFSDAQSASWLSSHPGEHLGDPLMADPVAGDFSLRPATACTTNGVARGAVQSPLTSPCQPAVTAPPPPVPQPTPPGGVRLESTQ